MLAVANPFRIPEDQEIFALRQRERDEKDAAHSAMQDAPAYLRASSAPRENFRLLAKIPPPRISAEEEALAQLILSPDSNETTEGLREFIGQKREVFLAQLAIDTKREELQRLERLEHEEQANLNAKEADISLFRDQFRAFLDADSKSLLDARRAAEAKSKQRLEVSLRIKQLSSQISTLRNDIAHLEEKLTECESFRDFIEDLTPPEWRKEHALPDLYFTKPDQLLQILQSLEEQNMVLIRHCLDAEEEVERTMGEFNRMLEQRDATMIDMVNRKNVSQRSLEDHNTQNAHYAGNQQFRHGNEFEEGELIELVSGITDFHGQLGFDAGASGDTVTMLKRIEDRMEEVFMLLAKRDEGMVKELFKAKLHNRRDHERAEKAAKKQKEQDEKTLRAIQLATMPIVRRTGRPLVPRSLPTQIASRERREEQMRLAAAQREADQNLLFGPVWD
jgi:hypothetical protein